MQIITKRAPGRRKKFFLIKGRQVDELSISEVKELLKNYKVLKRDMLIEYLHLLNDKYKGLYARHLESPIRSFINKYVRSL